VKRGGNMEHEDTKDYRKDFNKYNIPDGDYIIETRMVEESDVDNPGKTVTKEKKYIKWYGGTVKVYKIYYKE
jgi:hypothetical protein